jgi:hypothetical protein
MFGKYAQDRRILRFQVTPAVMKALRLIAMDSREDIETPTGAADGQLPLMG